MKWASATEFAPLAASPNNMVYVLSTFRLRALYELSQLSSAKAKANLYANVFMNHEKPLQRLAHRFRLRSW